MGELRHRGANLLVHLAQAEHAVMRVEYARPADFIAQWQGFHFELDPVVSRDIGAHVHLCRLLQVRVTEFKDDLWIAHGEAVFINNAPSQDEGIIVQAEVRRVQKYDFPDVRSPADAGVRAVPNPETFSRAIHELSEVTEAFYGGEAVWFQNDLEFEIMNFVERMAIRVLRLPGISTPIGLQLLV